MRDSKFFYATPTFSRPFLPPFHSVLLDVHIKRMVEEERQEGDKSEGQGGATHRERVEGEEEEGDEEEEEEAK